MIPYLDASCLCGGRLRSMGNNNGKIEEVFRCIECEERRFLPNDFKKRFDVFGGGENPWVEFEMKQLGVQKRYVNSTEIKNVCNL